jgi:hypothetical protein
MDNEHQAEDEPQSTKIDPNSQRTVVLLVVVLAATLIAAITGLVNFIPDHLKN